MSFVQIPSQSISVSQQNDFLAAAFAGAGKPGFSALNFWFRTYADRFDGMQWEYHRTRNSAYFLEPSGGCHLSLPNRFTGRVTAREAGIIAMLYTYKHLAAVAAKNGYGLFEEEIIQRYYRLREYVVHLPQQSAETIYNAID